MSQARRLSQSFTYSQAEISQLTSSSSAVVPSESETWVSRWNEVLARDIIDSRIVTVGAEVSVEDACDKLLSEDIPCLGVQRDQEIDELTGLFDFADVNAFLTLAATKHTLGPEDLRGHPNVEDIFNAAKAGHVPVYLVSNLSEKNPLQTLPHDATIVALLGIFARGTHRVVIRSPPPAQGYAGIVSDRRLLSWFASYAEETPSLESFLADSLRNFAFPSLHIFSSVVATTSKSTVLEAMKMMSDEGVSSVAVLDDDTGSLLSAVSVTDIGKVVSVVFLLHQVLRALSRSSFPRRTIKYCIPHYTSSYPISRRVSVIASYPGVYQPVRQDPDGSTDGVDKFPVYSVPPDSTLLYATQKILATNAHRVFITQDSPDPSSPIMSSLYAGNLSGIISIVDILSLSYQDAEAPKSIFRLLPVLKVGPNGIQPLEIQQQSQQGQ
ncbi:cell separation during budding [Marasmius crinis-equi]|uniref:Cell separation during budding n=1 Tax=Marasmius crinis-equi TaxID=585013 RepID=A0ABR3F1V6_9AGAR